MPPDCEINWKKHPTTIKGRHNFGTILDSSSEHYTGNMKLLLITIVTTCLATALALPSEKPKRGILPGDARYAADPHFQEKLLLPSNSYGPPQYQPGLPLGGDYAPPIIDAKYFTPAGIPDTIHTTKISKISSFPEVKTISTTTIAPPERFKTLTSYGTPIHDHFKSTLHPSDEILHTTLKPGLLHVTSPPLTTITHAPLAQEVTKITEVKTAIPLKTTFTAHKSAIGANLLAKGISEIHPNGFIDTAAYNLPASIHTRIQPVLEAHLHPAPQYAPDYHSPLIAPALKAVPQIHALPKTSIELPHTLTHTVKHVEPVYAAEAIGRLAPLTSVRTLDISAPAHIEETLPPCDTLAPINGIGTLDTLSQFRAASGLRTFNNLSPLYRGALATYDSLSPAHALKSFQPLHPYTYSPLHTAVRTYDTLPSAPAIKTFEPLPHLHPAHAVKTFETISPAPAIRTFEPLPQLHTAHAVKTFEPLPQLHTAHAVKTFEPLPQFHAAHAVKTFEPLPQLHTAHAVKTFEPLPQFHAAHAVKTFEPLPQLHTAHAVKTFETISPAPTIRTFEPLPQIHTAPAVKTFEPLPQLHPAPAIKSLEPLPPIHPITSVRTYQPLHAAHTVKTIETVNRIQPIPSIKSVETISPIETLRSLPPLGVSPAHHVTTLAPPVHSVTTLAPPVHHVTTVAPPLHSVHVLPSVKTFVGNAVHSQSTIGIPASLRYPSGSGASLAIENPALGSVEAISVTPSTEHFQAIAANGGYSY